MSEGKALDGCYQAIAVETFPGMDHDSTLEWQPRPYHNRGKIMIGGNTIEDDRLDSVGQERVPAGQSVRVFEMTVRFV